MLTLIRHSTSVPLTTQSGDGLFCQAVLADPLPYKTFFSCLILTLKSCLLFCTKSYIHRLLTYLAFLLNEMQFYQKCCYEERLQSIFYYVYILLKLCGYTASSTYHLVQTTWRLSTHLAMRVHYSYELWLSYVQILILLVVVSFSKISFFPKLFIFSEIIWCFKKNSIFWK